MSESRSQNGEDLIVAAQFPPGYVGTLLEIGAWEPTNLSNSRMLIDAGWNATLVEFSPVPVSKLVREHAGRAHRVNIIAAAITPGPEHVTNYQITDDALSTNDADQLRIWKDAGGYYGSLWVPTLSLQALLSQFFGGTVLDFVSIDTEGSSPELAIALLRTDHRPKVLCYEHNGRDVEVWQVAKKYGYRMVDKNQENQILCRE